MVQFNQNHHLDSHLQNINEEQFRVLIKNVPEISRLKVAPQQEILEVCLFLRSHTSDVSLDDMTCAVFLIQDFTSYTFTDNPNIMYNL